MLEAPPAGTRVGPGRPSTGARRRVLDAGFLVLKRDGYAGLTTAKVAAEAGQNKALISYHFGGKQGLVAEVAGRVSSAITDEVRDAIAGAESIERLAEAALDAVWRLMDRDEGIQRVYFDLTSQSVVDPEIQALMAEMRAGFRWMLHERLSELTTAATAAEIEAAAVFIVSGTEGLALERLDRGETPELAGARRLWVRSVAATLAR
jgi:AcrR family transcriptional regulator